MTAFDTDGRRVPVTDPVFPLDDEPVDPPRTDREAARRWVALLEWLTRGGEVVDAGRRAILLSFLLKLDGSPRSFRELGRALGMSHTHAARLCYRIRREIAAIGRESHS